MPCEKYSVEWCKRRKIPTVNIVSLLRNRELGLIRSGSHFIHGTREFYYSIPILRTLHCKNRPIFYPLRFTPDGKKFVGLSVILQDLFIYDYAGVQAGMASSSNDLFSVYFPSCKTIRFTHFGPQVQQPSGRVERFSVAMIRDTLLITSDSKHLIACSSLSISDNYSRLSGGVQKNNESLPPGSNLEDIIFYSVDLAKGEIMDQIHFDFDLIKNIYGVHLLERTLAILSIQHQTIHLFQIDRNTGAFISILQIGRTIFDDDRLYLGSATENAITERCFMGFRQRFLTYLYKENVANGKYKSFLRNISYYRSLKMHRIQFLGPDLILIRMDTNITETTSSNSLSVSYLFILWEWRTGTIIDVFHRSCEKLFKLFENFHEYFRAGSSCTLNSHFPTTMDHCGYVKNHYEYIKSTFSNCTPSEVRKQFLNFVPYYCPEVPSISPYLDPHMFSFDERCLLNIERSRIPTNQPLRMFNRRSNLLHGDIDLNCIKQYSSVRLIFHPHDPLALSVCKSQPDPNVTFHIPRACDR